MTGHLSNINFHCYNRSFLSVIFNCCGNLDWEVVLLLGALNKGTELGGLDKKMPIMTMSAASDYDHSHKRICCHSQSIHRHALEGLQLTCLLSVLLRGGS